MSTEVKPRTVPEMVGPQESREDVASYTDRALLLRAIHEVMVLRFDFGKLLAEMSDVKRRVSSVSRWSHGAEEEITLVRDLRKTVRRWRGRAIGATIAVLVIVVASYVCMRLGIRPIG